MGIKSRSTAPRFSTGDRVIIRDAIMSIHVGRLGTVVRAQSSKYSVTLDKYVVRLDSGEEHQFWDVQLKRPYDAVFTQ